ncbi:MAG: SDR family NAD(P)-dependent oxidoreductase [Myxococcota bacterium]
MKAVILGATSGMGRSISRQLAERGEQLFVLGFDAVDNAKTAADLSARSSKDFDVGHAVCDLAKPETFENALEQADEALDGFDTVVVTAAMFGTQEQLEQDLDRALAMLRVNFAHTVVFCEHAKRRMLARGAGTLCVFSSVAGDRGRKPVALYGSTKAGLSHYLESLDHKHRSDGLVTITVKPGFVKTPMTVGLKPPPFAGESESVAKQVIRAIEAGKPLVYAPSIWRWIMLVIRNLPRFVMRRIAF